MILIKANPTGILSYSLQVNRGIISLYVTSDSICCSREEIPLLSSKVHVRWCTHQVHLTRQIVIRFSRPTRNAKLCETLSNDQHDGQIVSEKAETRPRHIQQSFTGFGVEISWSQRMISYLNHIIITLGLPGYRASLWEAGHTFGSWNLNSKPCTSPVQALYKPCTALYKPCTFLLYMMVLSFWPSENDHISSSQSSSVFQVLN
jgi:hypothetical protein